MPIPTTDPIVNIPLVTPFDEEDRVDHDAHARNIQRWLETPATGFLVGSQTGEEWSLSEDEKLALAKTTKDNLDEKRFLVGGIDCPSATETLRRAEAFAGVGAEVVRVRFPRNTEMVRPYFQEVLPRCPVPVLLMHQCDPKRFGLAAEPAGPAELLAEVTDMDNVFGYVTDHDVRFEARVRQSVTRDRRFWICNGSIILHGTLIGCNGTTTAFSNIWPAAMDELLRQGMAGNYLEASALQTHIQKIDAVMLPYLGAGVKACLKLLGFEGMRPRTPTPSVSSEVVAQIEKVMCDAGLLTK